MAKTITWLHLSDLHCCPSMTGYDADQVLASLRDDLRKLEERHGLRPDLVFFTGDAAYGRLGTSRDRDLESQFDEATLFFQEILCIYTEPIPAENLFLVPGNHDIDRQKVQDKETAWLEKLAADYSVDPITAMIRDASPVWQDYMRRLGAYRDFLKVADLSHLLQDEERLVFSHVREMQGLKVGIAGLSSAWSCRGTGNDEKSKLWLAGDWQINQLHSNLRHADLRICLVHHPTNWFVPAEDSALQPDFEGCFHFHLHGHEHSSWVTANGVYTRIAAGACYDCSDKPNGYNIVRLDLDTGQGEVWLREYKKEGRAWRGNEIPGKTDERGVWQLPSLRWLPGGTRPKGIKPMLPQPLAPEVPLPTLSSGPESRGVFGRRKDIQALADTLVKKPIVLVYGLSGIGKTSLVGEVGRTEAHQNREFHHIAAFPGLQFETLFQLLAPALGSREERPTLMGVGGQLSFSPLAAWARKAQPCLILLERAHELFSETGFLDHRVGEFLHAIAQHAPQARVVLESRQQPPRRLLLDRILQVRRVQGLGVEAVGEYFQRPFPETPEIGWSLQEDAASHIYSRLGGDEKGVNSAHPLGMLLLATVARGLGVAPLEVLSRHRAKLLEELNDSLFGDLFDHVLTAQETAILKTCSLYREGIAIPDLHVETLSRQAGDSGEAFHGLIRRCIITPGPNQEHYYLHTLLAELARQRFAAGSNEFFLAHEAVADAWLSRLKLSQRPTLANIVATREALHHLAQAERFDRLAEITARLLDKGVVPFLEDLQIRLFNQRQFKEQRSVLALWVVIEEDNHKAHRFVAEAIERVEGRGVDEALLHYEIALSFLPAYPHYLTSFGRCLLARGEEARLLEYVCAMDAGDRRKALTDDVFYSVYSACVARSGQPEEASRLRQERIDAGSNNAAFYNDEALYQHRKGNSAGALRSLELAEKNHAADDFTLSIKAQILGESGQGVEASRLRQERIDAGSRDAAFYADEALYQHRKGNSAGALRILELAEKNHAADDFTLATKAQILGESGQVAEGSRLRQERIDAGSNNAAFYNDEALYQHRKGDSAGALRIIELAEKNHATDDYTFVIKTQILGESG
ncbi:MAG TPA: metallophosphoesterase [Thermoanaerobaculia bacterium]|nr:metallophosphoesterase [Thermoanaerobaculia bacterium]